MTGFQLDEDESKKLEKYLDLDDKELKVYLGLLSLGNVATLGQISMTVGFDILVTNASLESLTHKGFITFDKSNISRYYALEPFLESYTKLFDPIGFAGIIRKLSKSLESSPLSIVDDANLFNQYLHKTLTEKKKEIFKTETLDETQEKLIDESIKIIADTAFSIVQDMETKGKKIQSKLAKQFQTETNAVFQAISEARNNLTELNKISREIKHKANFHHDVLIGESSILVSLRDIVTRAKSSLLVFMPIPEIKSLLNLVELTQRLDIKIDVIGDLEKTPSVILEKVKSEGIGINLGQLDEIDFWGVIMDENELMLAPVPKEENETVTGIMTTYKPLIKQFSEQLRKYIMRARPLQ